MPAVKVLMMKQTWGYEDPSPISPPFTRVQVNGAWCAGSLYRLSYGSTMWTMWNDVRPQCNHCQLTLSFAALPDTAKPTGNGNPTGRLRFRRLQLTKHFWGCFRLGLRREGKLRPIKWEIGRRIWFLESHSPLLVVAMVPRRRCSPGVISQLSGQAWPNLPWWLAARAALTHPTTLPTFITIPLPIFISWYILFSISIIRKSLSSIWSIACVDYQ